MLSRGTSGWSIHQLARNWIPPTMRWATDRHGGLKIGVAGAKCRRIQRHDRGDRAGRLFAEPVDRLARDGVRDVPGQQAEYGGALRGENEEALDPGSQPFLVRVDLGDRAHDGLDQVVHVGVEQDHLELALGSEMLVDEGL